jgi:hypothetical protein
MFWSLPLLRRLGCRSRQFRWLSRSPWRSRPALRRRNVRMESGNTRNSIHLPNSPSFHIRCARQDRFLRTCADRSYCGLSVSSLGHFLIGRRDGRMVVVCPADFRVDVPWASVLGRGGGIAVWDVLWRLVRTYASGWEVRLTSRAKPGGVSRTCKLTGQNSVKILNKG